MEVSVQTIQLSVSEHRKRIPVTFPELRQTSSWAVASCVRIKPTWVQVETYPSLDAHPLLSSHLLLLGRPDSKETHVVYPVSTLEVNNNLIIENSTIFANARRAVPGKDENVHVIHGRSCGSRDALVQEVIDAARRLSHGQPRVDSSSGFWDGLGICTWESFGANRVGPVPDGYTKEKLLGVLPSYPMEIFLIDDGWQHHNKDAGGRKSYPPRARLVSFRANDQFDGDMEETIRIMKERGIKKVGVWMALEGYWYGIDPDGELAEEYACQPHRVTVPKQVRGGVKESLDLVDPPQYLWLPAPDKAYNFWFDWFTILKSRGVDFVKVDNQACMEYIQSDTSRHALASMWAGVLRAVKDVWGDMNRIIMCMSHNERMLNGPGGLDFSRPSGNLVFRNSDDYNMPYSNPHGEFILWNTRNSILTSHLSLVPDYDMFASNPKTHRPLYHALLRAMSVGTILLSDTPDTDTDFALLDSLTGRNAQGDHRLVRANAPAVQLANRWFDLDLSGTSSGKAHLAGVWNEKAKSGLIGAWNCREPGYNAICRDTITHFDLEDIIPNRQGSFVIWPMGYSRDFENERFSKSNVYQYGTNFGLDLKLEEAECEGFIVTELHPVQGAKVAVLGMLDRLWPSGGIQVNVDEHDQRLRISTTFDTDRFSLFIQGVIRIQVGSRTMHLVGEGCGEKFEFPLSAGAVLEVRVDDGVPCEDYQELALGAQPALRVPLTA